MRHIAGENEKKKGGHEQVLAGIDKTRYIAPCYFRAVTAKILEKEENV